MSGQQVRFVGDRFAVKRYRLDRIALHLKYSTEVSVGFGVVWVTRDGLTKAFCGLIQLAVA